MPISDRGYFSPFSRKNSVSITDGTGALDVTIAHSAMEQLFDYAFPIKNVLKMKKELKEGFLRKKITF